MDISNLDVVSGANTGAICELVNPVTGEALVDGEGKKEKPFFIKLLGSDSDTYRQALKVRLEKAQDRKKKKISLEDATRSQAELYAKCTTDCFMIENGKPVEFSFEEMVRLYIKYPWLREQAEIFIADRSSFMKS